MLVSSSAYFFTLKMEAISSSEKSVDTQRNTRRYIPQGGKPAFTLVSSSAYFLNTEDGGDMFLRNVS
jgi:hypothetical protein